MPKGQQNNVSPLECTFCGITYLPKQMPIAGAKTNSCGKPDCHRAYERNRMRDRYLEGPKTFNERVLDVPPNTLIEEMEGKIVAGKLTANGGGVLHVAIGQAEKYQLLHLTDFQGVKIMMSFSTLPEEPVEEL